MKRREFLQYAGWQAACLACTAGFAADRTTPARPNILWILAEDISPDLACYGTAGVQTPHLDALAAEGVRFTSAFTTSPVCSTSRSGLITGMHPGSIGAHHHRSHRSDGYVLPGPVKPITDYLRRAGYFTCNVKTAAPGVQGSGKTDWNFQTDGKVFEGTDWNQRRNGQPFFAQLSLAVTHRGGHWRNLEQQLAQLHLRPVDPAAVHIPPFYPDHEVVRRDWANYLDAIQVMDGYVGRILRRLDDEGLRDNTLVIFIGDHGRCHVRAKQWLYDGGIHIPLIVRHPAALPAGQVRDDLVSGIDIAATVLAAAGIKPPAYMQGRVFWGPTARPRQYLFAARDRCDETVDVIRCVHDQRYSYLRNFLPQRPWMAANQYKDSSYPVRDLLRRLQDEGKLSPAQRRFLAPTKPAEELYDLHADPNELVNLADSPDHREVLQRLRAALKKWILAIQDQGLIPEPILEDARLQYGNEYNILAQPSNRDLPERILAVTDLTDHGPSALPDLTKALRDPHDAVRYWAATAIGDLAADARPAAAALQVGLRDACGAVRVACARAFCRMGR
ncbi:MAG: sulfatase-like hydrolase/transferase, partial [Sedimentisphaerales bacterium]|nr:sulfatase-like hydrolase/transferase [Sedimentisphaerales bacterium]